MAEHQNKHVILKSLETTQKHAEGSVLVEYGETKVICTASAVNSVPSFLRGKKTGWLTAEYGMLPRSTNERMNREASRGKQQGRTQEIQRLIGRSLRAAVDLDMLGENTIYIDCDVIQADGGTRTASITGACVAVCDALTYMKKQKNLLPAIPLRFLVASVSVGIFKDHAVIDLDYDEDSTAETDMNVVMSEHGDFIEVQGTAEGKTFSIDELNKMIAIADQGIKEIITIQRHALEM